MLQSKVVYLQETQLTSTEILRLRRRWQGQVITASFSSHSREVAILIHKSVPFQVTDINADIGGRYIIIQGTLLGEQLNLINVYGPNIDDQLFYNNLFLNISSLRGNIIMGGDFNCTLNPLVDRSSGIDASHIQTRRVISQFMTDMSRCDIWRVLNPDKKEFSCYSSTYHTYSRIDYFLISKNLMPNVKNCTYGSIVISDHAPLTLDYIAVKPLKGPPRWRFDTKWLHDPSFVSFLDSHIDMYFQINTTQTSPSVR